MQKMAEAGKQKQKEGDEKEKAKGEEMEVDAGKYANNETACEGEGGLQEDFREMVKRLAQERVAARGGGQGVRGSAGERGETSGQRREVQGGRNEDSAVSLAGEERYEESDWAIARLKRGDESGCVGVKTRGGGRCSVTSFERTRDKCDDCARISLAGTLDS
jgi:uncharacterized protein with ACT and thioredoxin-like domain